MFRLGVMACIAWMQLVADYFGHLRVRMADLWTGPRIEVN